MSVMISSDKKELIVTCKCGCQDAIHIKIDDEDKDADYYAIQTYLSNPQLKQWVSLPNIL